MATVRSRRHDVSDATRQALVDAAVAVFTERGYVGTSLDEIARRAGVTKGAVYHHFAGKDAVFEAAFEAVHGREAAQARPAGTAETGPWDAVRTAVRSYLEASRRPAFRRIAVQEAPVVLGWERWREREIRHGLGALRSALQALLDAGELDPLPVEQLTAVVFGALTAGAMTVADDEPRTADAVAGVVERLLRGLRRAEPG